MVLSERSRRRHASTPPGHTRCTATPCQCSAPMESLSPAAQITSTLCPHVWSWRHSLPTRKACGAGSGGKSWLTTRMRIRLSDAVALGRLIETPWSAEGRPWRNRSSPYRHIKEKLWPSLPFALEVLRIPQEQTRVRIRTCGSGGGLMRLVTNPLQVPEC